MATPVHASARSAALASRLAACLAALALAVTAACAPGAGRRPVLETGPGAETTTDGLRRLQHSGFAHAWVRPDAPLSSYGTIVLGEPLVAYARTPRRYASSLGSDPNYPLSDSQMATLKRYFRESFEQEFARSAYFRLVEGAGPDTLLVEPAIADLIVRVPTRSRPATDKVFSQKIAEMTLLLDVRDARTGEAFLRVADRRAARPPGANQTTTLTWSNGVNDAAAYRHTFRAWARALRLRLDEAHAAQTAWSTAP